MWKDLDETIKDSFVLKRQTLVLKDASAKLTSGKVNLPCYCITKCYISYKLL